MHDPQSLLQFEEHHVLIPMCVLEELDDHKKGKSDESRNVRQALRKLEEFSTHLSLEQIKDGIPIPRDQNKFSGKIFFQTNNHVNPLPQGLVQGKVDNEILGVVLAEKHRAPERSVVLVSKDINMRIKAKTLGITAEDYTTDKVIEDSDLVYSGVCTLTADEYMSRVKESQYSKSTKQCELSFDISGLGIHRNSFVVANDSEHPRIYKVISAHSNNACILTEVPHYKDPSHQVWGIHARNIEQSCAINLLLDSSIDLVTLLGSAGTGKTLLALATGLVQTQDRNLFNEIIMTRVTVPLGEDIGFLPGTEEEKMEPWMGALLDNLEVLAEHKKDGSNNKHPNDQSLERKATMDLMRNRIKIRSLNFMRGRTFLRKFIILDEAQNLTPKQMKALITRAGPGTKIVCLGNVAQIDTPYLTEGSSGLTNAVLRFKGWKHFGHITLMQGERSRLADRANDVM